MGALSETPERVVALRQSLVQTAKLRVPTPTPVAHVETLSAPARLRLYRPDSPHPLPLLFLLHGGAWIAGSIDTHDEIARVLATRIPATVASLDYDLAPEHRWPHQIEQAEHALRFLHAGSERVAVLGDSAGGQIAAILAARFRGGPALAAQVLVNPALDLDTESLAWYAALYLPAGTDLARDDVSPLHAASVAGLPPTLVVAGALDPLHGQNLSYAERLRAADVETDFLCLDGHGHFGMKWAVADPALSPAIDRTVEFLRRHLYPPGA
ncbi:MAG: esterase [Rhodospirillales bacterium]|nr:esterase [Rhodospirillales bacterium]